VDDIDALIDGIGDSKPTPQKTIDPIDAAIDNVAGASDEAFNVNMLAGSKSDPERYAKAKKLIGFVGLTADIVERNLEEVEQKVKRRTAEGKINRAPVLRERMTADRDFVKLTMDDEVLPDVETALRTQGFKAASIQRRKAQDREIKDRWDRLLSVKQSRSVVDVVTDPLKAAAAGSNIMAAGMVEFGRYNPVDIVFNKALGVFAPDVKAELDESRNQVQNQFNSGVEFWNEKKSFDIQDRIEAFNQAGISDAIGMLVTDPGLLIDQLAQSSPYLIPGAAAARGGTAAMLGYTSIVEAMDAANSARQEAIAAGATPDQQNASAAIAALVTAPIAFLGNKLTGTAKIETDFLTKGTISNTMLSAMVREAISGAAEEGGNQYGVNLGAILGYDDDRESTEGVGKAAAIGGVLEAVQGGGMRAISLASQKINGETEIAQDIMADAEAMQAAVEMVSQTKLLQRDEASLRGYMQQVANDMGVETVDGETKVYLSPEALSQIVSELPGIEQDLATAQEAGHDVAVNLGDLIVAMSKTGTSQEIIPAIRFSANQPTVAEAQINAQPEMQRMIDTANQIAAQEVENTKFQQESQAVYDDVLNQLIQANRFSRDVNAPYAKLHQAFYQTYAHRMGMGVGEFYERFGMKISDTDNGGLEQANEILTAFDEADLIEIQPRQMTEQEIDDDQTSFLSAFPKGSRYTRDTKLLKRIRSASDVATEELGGSPESARRVTGELGPFSSYQITGSVLPPDSFNPNGLLTIQLYGDEQLDEGITVEPALTFTVSANGELTVNGPSPSGETFQQFKARGWADVGTDAAGEAQSGWSALTNPNNPSGNLPMAQIMPLLADVHARTKLWKQADYVGLHWSRSTGALGGLMNMTDENGTAVYFQGNQTDMPAFKKWFGDSKVVDADGNPLVVYHGTGARFDVFDANKIGAINGRSEGPGFYFTTNKTVAEMYSKRGDTGALLEVYLNITKPLRYDAPPFSEKKLQALLVEIARQELAQDTELEDWRDGYLANYVYTPEFKTLEAAAKEATKLFDGSETALDQMGGIIGGGVPADYLNAAVRKALGYDGYISQGFGNIGDAENTIYVAMDSTQIKSATDNTGTFDPNNPNILMQSPIFYSQLRTQLEAAKIDNVPASQWKAWLNSNAPKLGIKKAEIEATGITDWLDLQDGKINKSVVLEFLDGNGVQVEDVLLFDRDGAINDEPAFYEQSEGEDMRWRVYGYEATLDDVYDTEAEAKARTDEINANQPAGDSEYSQYTVPGGENYKELLLTLPGNNQEAALIRQKKLDEIKARIVDLTSQWNAEKVAERRIDLKGKIRDAEFEYDAVEMQALEDVRFKSSHFTQKNILAHVRFDERTDADGNRVLFVQEIQSDWGQEGKKKGFVERYKPEDVSTLEPDAPEANQPDLFWYFRVPGNVLQIPKSRYETEASALNYVLTEKQTISGATAPKAPFVTDTKAWVALAIKRMMRYAVDNGFDKVAFINSQQASDLYDLSKQVDEIYVETGSKEGDYLIGMKKGGRDMSGQNVSKNDLPAVVGKELAEKIVQDVKDDGEIVTYSGLDLKVGGEGMRAFYDQIVPQVANDVLKKIGGGKVDTVNLANKESDFDFIELGDATESELEQLRGDGIILPQTGFTITPEMRETIVKGLPLFQNDNAPRGTFNPDTRTIALLNAADLSTFLHESSHGFLEILTELAMMPDAPMEVIADTQKVMDWFGTDLLAWNDMTLNQKREFHEKWAEASERYFFEGKAPTLELQGIFQKFRDWVKSVYKTLQDLVRLRPGAAELTDEIRQVMDRIYATDEAIAAAQETRMLLPLFGTQEESGLNDDDWREYLANAQAATQTAIDEMNARSLRDMKWMRRARDGYIRDLQKETEALRRETTMEARRNVLSEPVYQAWTFLTGKEWGKVSRAKASKSLDPVNDSLLVAIAKLGGVDMTEADKDFGFDPLDMKIKPVFGKPVFRKSGGKSFDAMAELLAEYGYLSLDENGRHDLRDLEDYLFDEVRGIPHYSFAHEFAKDDRQDVVDLVLQLPAGRLNLDMVKAMLGDRWDEVSGKLGRMVASDGIDPDIVADQYRNPEGGEAFLSGMDMIEKLIQAVPPSQAIQAETDRLMLERYGDINSPEALESAADEALHNEAMLKMSATELKALLKINTPVRQLEKAAKDSAIQVLSRTLVKELNPNKYASAAARAAREADKAVVKKDIDTAAQQKRMHALNLSLTKEAYAAKAEVTKALSDMRKLRKSDKDMAKTHDINLIDAARSIANAFGINGAIANPAEALAAMEKIKHYNAEVYDQLLPVVQAAAFNAKSYRDLTLEDFRGLSATIKQLMHQARRSKQITVDGRKVDLMSAREALIERMQELGIKEDSPGEKQAVTDKERAWWNLQGMKNALRRMESWVDAKDGGDFAGVFRTYLYSAVRDGVDKYRTEKNRVLKKYIAELQKKDTLGHFSKAKIAAHELGYSFGSENGNGKQELLGAMLHVGNDSNKRKLLLGRGWGKLVENPDGTRTLDSTQWDNFMRRMFSENVITKADMDFLQFTWDLMESIKPDAQKAHFELYGYYFDEITADPIQTPWGEYRGGYAPAKADTELVQDAAIRQGANEIENDFNYMMPTTGNGFTKGRVEYNRPLVMDLRLFAQHIDAALRFTYIQPAINDTLKLVKDREVSETLRKFDQTALDALIMPWLQRTAQQIRTTPFTGKYDGKALSRFFTGMRRNTGMSIMMANMVNALQQTTGLSLAAVKVKPRYLKASLAKWTASPNAISNSVAELSPWMRGRLDSDIFEMQQAMDDILLGANQYDKMKGFITRHAYFLQRAFQNAVDLISWQAAFEEAQENGMEIDQAVKRADFVVRETQSSLAPEDISKFETGNAFVQLFTQFYNYFNMQANLLGTEFSKTLREQGVRKGSGRLLYLYVFGFAIPALMADAIVRTFGWDWDDEDDDGYLDEFNAWFFGAQFRTATAMTPGVGPTINAFVNRFNKLPYDDRISTSPAVSMIEQAAGAPVSTYKAVFDDGSWKRAIRDNLTLISLTTGVPVLPLSRPLGYAADMAQDKVQPSNPVDLARGLVTGKGREEERTR